MTRKLLPPFVAIVFAALLCSLAMLFSGRDPVRALSVMVTQVGVSTTMVDIVNNAAIYYLAALAVAIGFQMNLFNIGVEGQFRVAAVTAAIVGAAVSLPAGVHTVVILIVAALAGAAYAAVPAILKVTRGVNEVISTLMLNAVASGVVAYLIRQDTFGVLRGSNIGTKPIPPSGWVPGISLGSAGTIFGLVPFVVLIGVGYWVLINRTRFGFELRASGFSMTAAAAGGVNAKRMVVIAMLLSGAVAGLVSLPGLLGKEHLYAITSTQGYGFTGIAVALLGRNHPAGMAFGALLWAFLDSSAVALDNIGVPREIVTIMQGLIVLSVVVAYEVVRRLELVAEKRRVGPQFDTVEPATALSGGRA